MNVPDDFYDEYVFTVPEHFGVLVGDEEFEPTANALRTVMLTARKEKNLAITAEAKATLEFSRLVGRWAKSLNVPVGGARFFNTVYEGVPMVIKLTQPVAGSYGIQYIKEG